MNHNGSRGMRQAPDTRQRVSLLERLSILLVLAALLVALVSPATVSALQAPDPAPARALTTGEVDDDSLAIIEEYRIQGDTLVDNGTPIPALHQQVWDRYALLFPAAGRPEVDLFVGIDTEGSGGTDGAMQVNAIDTSKRYLALDVSGTIDISELTRTMIHETAHLLQFRPSALEGAPGAPCDVYDGGEGCSIAGSYLRAWSQRFYPDVSGSDYPATPADVAARYTPDSYVTGDYAATNPAEDMAETFAEWVLLDAPTGPSFVTDDPRYAAPVTGTRLVDDKLRFFDQFPDLVTMRAGIRANLGLDALEAAPAPATPVAPRPTLVDPGPTGDEILALIKENETAAAEAAAAEAEPAPATAPAAAATVTAEVAVDAAPVSVPAAPAAAPVTTGSSLAVTGVTTDVGLALGTSLIGVGCLVGATARRRRR